ncbi:MAG: hypothetical protein B7Y45_05305 [Sphingomonas sp. 28-66-16]|nr:MAG: hypothetical protein B7Y45_05305 [Sphingomonas sp. 28-66-16]
MRLSEDMPHGYVMRGVTVIDPPADTAPPKPAGLVVPVVDRNRADRGGSAPSAPAGPRRRDG